ncbi:ribbon-helix-helix domain-containing protein [Sphingomonas floccifaciens]|uniref:Ribbon-helix-helix domain-containing protein n=1 Tax=Sphingomonas floccifaciens TaxID=1844115 RepID=A0ABW4NI86_9SPHN
MSRKPSFANLRGTTPAAPAPAPTGSNPAQAGAGEATDKTPPSRQGRKQIAGFFSPEMSFAMHMLARRQGRSLQALMTEAFNDVLRKHGESPVGD